MPAEAQPILGQGLRQTPAERHRALPRQAWLLGALALIVWQAWTGRAGVALLVFAAALPLTVLPQGRRSAGRGLGWMLGLLAPALGLVGLAAAYPAFAGQFRSPRQRAAVAALGYWWLTLAEPLAGRRLWLGPSSSLPPRSVWESSLSSAADHVIDPMLTLGVLLGVLLWAGGSVVLPWLVRGRSALIDALLASVWAAALFAAAPQLDGGLGAHASLSPRGALLGAVLGAAVAVAARALRGPVGR